MSTEFMFGAGRGKVSISRDKALNRVAKKHNGYFVSANIPGNGDQYWFAIPNLGSPHDQNTASEIISEAESKKLWPISRSKA